MDKNDVQIIVVERDKLFEGHEPSEGFKPHSEEDYESKILEHKKPMRRGDAEKDPSHKQPISYILIVNPKEKKVFAYQRNLKDNDEQRLKGKWSWGVGGHIDHSDDLAENPIKQGMLRELSEEVEINGDYSEPKIFGYINYEQTPLEACHLGLLYLLEVEGDVTHKDKDLHQSRFLDLDELKEILKDSSYDVEKWSQIAFQPLKEYFDKL